MRRFVVAAAIVLAASAAEASPVTVRVVEVAGGVAYVDQGSTAGLARGTKITFPGGVVLVVVEVTDKTASVELGSASLAIGVAGTADVTPRTSAVDMLPKPRPPEAFKDQWPAATPPALAQTPKHVPLGSGKAKGRASIAIIAHGYAAGDKNRIDAGAEARLIASFELMSDKPLAADIDVAGRVYREGANSRERIPGFVRAAQIRYGADPNDPAVVLGRLRYAASAVGMLDGGRAAAHVGKVEIAAFGGLVPDPINGKPETSASRFGAEAIYDDATHPWNPRASLTAYGSTWDGKLDERRLVATASAWRAAWWFDGWAEAQQFSSDNPWGAKSLEIVGAGTTAQFRNRGTHLGVDVTYLRPERSLRLASALPADWLCTANPQPGDVPETCGGGDSWSSGSLFVGTRGRSWSVDAIGTVGRTNGRDIVYDSSGYLGAEVRIGPRRLFASVSAGRAAFARWTAGEVGVGVVLTRKLDATLHYRPELLDYVAATEPFLLHSGIVDVHLAARRDLDLALSAVGTTGTDRDAIAILSTLAWRPL